MNFEIYKGGIRRSIRVEFEDYLDDGIGNENLFSEVLRSSFGVNWRMLALIEVAG